MADCTIGCSKSSARLRKREACFDSGLQEPPLDFGPSDTVEHETLTPEESAVRLDVDAVKEEETPDEAKEKLDCCVVVTGPFRS